MLSTAADLAAALVNDLQPEVRIDIDYGHCCTHVSKSGDVQFIWESNPLGRINEAIIKSVGFLYRSEEEIKNGAGFGATAFLVSVPEPKAACGDEDLPLGFRHAYVVTAAHVVKDGFTVLRIAGTSGGFKVFKLPRNAKHIWNDGTLDDDIWRRHDEGHDLAVYPLPVFPNVFNAIGVEHFATPDVLSALDVGTGDEVFMPGRLLALGGLEDPPPVVRFGKIATMPEILIANPTVEEGTAQPSFLVEMRSESGYSGAPVLITRPPLAPTPESESVVLKDRAWLLGINWGHLSVNHPDDWRMRSNTHVVNVIPAEKLLEVLQYDDLKIRRQRVLEAHQQSMGKLPVGVPD